VVGQSDEHNSSGSAGPGGLPPLRSLRSEDILQGYKEVVIEHGGQRYRLRVTSAGKLILTK
jgi:hemin uptake protein HemP